MKKMKTNEQRRVRQRDIEEEYKRKEKIGRKRKTMECRIGR